MTYYVNENCDKRISLTSKMKRKQLDMYFDKKTCYVKILI